MNILRFSFMLVTLTFTSFPVFSAPLKNYLYTSSGNLEKIKPLLIRPDLGGPDIIPNKKGHMKNAYPFFHQYKGKLGLVTMAVQEPTLTYTNSQTRRPFTKAEFTDYAENYLGSDIIFWSLSSPWLDRQ